MAHLVFIHGVGGVKDEADWRVPLNVGLQSIRAITVSSPSDTITVPGYVVGTNLDAREVDVTYKEPGERVLLHEKLQFQARQKTLERVVRARAETPRTGLGGVPMTAADPIGEALEYFRFPDVQRYLDSNGVRNDVWRQVLDQLPAAGPVIIVAHSLGSVVIAGLLHRLPPGLTVDLLVTIGSPLPFARMRSHIPQLKSAFPYSRVHRWLNVHAPMDGVTGGRGIAGVIPQAVDVSADIGTTHALEAYMVHRAVAAAIASVAFPEVVDEPNSGGVNLPTRPIHESWHPLLLGTAFSLQVARSMSSSQWREHLRLEAAREEVARRVVADIDAKRFQRAEQIKEFHSMGAELPSHQFADHPLSDGRYPHFRDLTVDAAAVLEGEWRDSELLALAVGLMIQPLVDPFDIEANSTRRRDALEATLNVIRARRGNLSDKQYANEVSGCVDWAKDQLSDSSFPWGKVLIVGGLAVLAMTGVGLAVAAPAGLAGAAIVTSTLATFGPGGMVGGLLSLGVLTGTATSLTSLGVRSEVEGFSAVKTQQLLAARSGVELAGASIEGITVTLTGMLAVVRAQISLSFPSTEPMVRVVIDNALETARSEYRQHQQLAPDNGGTKMWERKVRLLDRAFAALNTMTGIPQVLQLDTARKAIESGKRPVRLPRVVGPARQLNT